ncbi:DNA-3-methyladenine glycosylase [Oceanicella sp. SM1341]|uniref:DNA-3-methyladenine glycosylase family protein n=1 Tax=Oceanicella sp. SM1341 TaxID=1548889 RepID=UPI000E4A4ABF|nr:DNA-3-methyladenine glycosylase [Oceanicella sp. SM1341]
MTGRIIETDADVAEGAAWLARHDPRFVPILAATGALPLRRRADGFEALLNAIVGQQISTAAAAGIWARMEAAGAHTLEGVAALDDAALLGCGLSRPKLRYIRALAESGFSFDTLRGMTDEEVVAALVSLKGIGRWTAEVYAMFSLGRADVFAAGDLALQEAARLAFALPDRPSERALREMAAPWSPWRAVAARALWAYYRVAKQREGVRT